MKKIFVFNALIAIILLILAGCASNKADIKKINEIATINFNLPQQIKWKQMKNQASKGSILAEWIPEDYILATHRFVLFISAYSPRSRQQIFCKTP